MAVKIPDAKKYNFSETLYQKLMQSRIYKILIICSNYDFYMLEEDGRIDEQLFNEYVSLNLSNPPIFIHANNEKTAFEILSAESIDLIITMLSLGQTDAFDLSRQIKKKHSEIPIVVLTPFSRELTLRYKNENLSAIDYVFSWLGDADILLAIIKLIEDSRNVSYDTQQGVQAILLVEDSIRFYSSYLPIMYRILLNQSRLFACEGLNEYYSMMSKRGRPKILLATNYEDAKNMFDSYKDNLLGVISDISFDRHGTVDSDAGFRFVDYVLQYDQHIPIILQSSDDDNRQKIDERKIGFINKSSKNISFELKEFMTKNFAFGDFVFRNPETQNEIARAQTVQILQKIIKKIPIESRVYHFNRNELSRWLNARGLFPIAKLLKDINIENFDGVEEATKYLVDAISHYRAVRGHGIIAKFERSSYDEYITFARIGNGSLGGKARGLAFIDLFLKRNNLCEAYENIQIKIPQSVVLATDIFEEFMESNNLYEIALSDLPDEQILRHFIDAQLPTDLIENLKIIINFFNHPIAIRSSSLLEDSHYQPFAGIYSTYMIPNDKAQPQKTLNVLTQAIKSVFASVYYKNSKAYIEATSNVIDEERMAVIIQEVCGNKFDNYFAPSISGVARSINYYPIPPEKSSDGIAKIAFGLGKVIVEGETVLRFSPKYPNKILQLSSTKMALKETQNHLYALNLDFDAFVPSVDDAVNLKKIRVANASKHPAYKSVVSTYDYQNDIIRDNTVEEGKRIVTFANILNHKTFPLPEIILSLLHFGESEMNNPVEIEFAVDLNTAKDSSQIFNVLQIRPIVDKNDTLSTEIEEFDFRKMLIFCESALGNGQITDISDFVYIKTQNWQMAKNVDVVNRIENINTLLINQNRNYILAGPGRWGSVDPWLGIPVKWPQISGARLIVEVGLQNYRIEPSQGTHFFQNLTSLRVGYFTINPYSNDGFIDMDYLSDVESIYEDDLIRHVRFTEPLVIRIDGKNNKGVVYKANTKAKKI